jgi:hypothetical protein
MVGGVLQHFFAEQNQSRAVSAKKQCRGEDSTGLKSSPIESLNDEGRLDDCVF